MPPVPQDSVLRPPTDKHTKKGRFIYVGQQGGIKNNTEFLNPKSSHLAPYTQVIPLVAHTV